MSERPEAAIRVSTIIPVYNGAATVARAIDSALAQDFEGQEIILVNDGSTDNTADVLAKYAHKVRVINKPNGGAASARNAGIAVARGEYVAFLDADDIWLQSHVMALVDVLAREPQAVLAYGDFRVVGEDDTVFAESVFSTDQSAGRPPTMDEMLERTWPILPSATIVRADAIRSCGGFDESFKAAAWEDFYLWLVLREYGPFISVPKVAAIHVDHPDTAPDKYREGQDRFLHLIRIRYGKRSRALRRSIVRDFSSKLFFRGLARVKRSEYFKGLCDLLHATRYSPVWVVRNAKPVRRGLKFARQLRTNFGFTSSNQ